MKLLTNLALFSILFITLPTFAIERCATIFTFDMAAEKFDTLEVSEIARDQGQHSGQLIYLKRNRYQEPRLFKKPLLKQHPWSNYKHNPDKPGNLTWGFQFLPPAVQNLFGMKILRSDLVPLNSPKDENAEILVLPNAQEIVNIHESVFHYIQQKHPGLRTFRFYKSDEIIDGMEYIRMIAEYGALPIGTNHYLLQHDFNYHVLSGLVIPDLMYNALIRRTKLILQFYDFISSRAEQIPYHEYIMNKLNNNYFNYASHSIDLIGNIFNEGIRFPLTSPDRESEIIESTQIIFLKQRSPIQYLHELLRKNNIDSYFKNTNKSINKSDYTDVYNEFIEQLDPSYIKEDLPEEIFHDRKYIFSLTSYKLRQIEKIAREMNKLK